MDVAGNLCKLCGCVGGHFTDCPARILDELSTDPVDFDLMRMQRALEGGRVTLPDDISREEFRVWMLEQANKLTNKPVILICSDALPHPYDVLSLGERIHERLGADYKVVIYKPRVPGDNRLDFALEETWMSSRFRDLDEVSRFTRHDFDSVLWELPERSNNPEPWKPNHSLVTPHQPKPVGRVADSMLGLLARSKGSNIKE